MSSSSQAYTTTNTAMSSSSSAMTAQGNGRITPMLERGTMHGLVTPPRTPRKAAMNSMRKNALLAQDKEEEYYAYGREEEEPAPAPKPKKRKVAAPKPAAGNDDGENAPQQEVVDKKPLDGVRIVFTGLFNIPVWTLKSRVAALGARVTGGCPSSKTDIMVVGEDPGPAKLIKAQSLPNLQVVSEDAIVNMIKSLPGGHKPMKSQPMNRSTNDQSTALYWQQNWRHHATSAIRYARPSVTLQEYVVL
jgi:NAD-dependent DNA ligase